MTGVSTRIHWARLSHYSKLSLNNEKLEEVPQDVSLLGEEMEKMELARNQLARPASLLPLCSLQGLRKLNLSQNQLTNLPSRLQDLKQLDELNLSRNMMQEFPLVLLQMPHLHNLYLAHNQIQSLPNDIALLASLRNLNLSDNLLVLLPVSIGQLVLLTNLDLSDNRLHQLPASIANLHRLRTLLLEGNSALNIPHSVLETGPTKIKEYVISHEQFENAAHSGSATSPSKRIHSPFIANTNLDTSLQGGSRRAVAQRLAHLEHSLHHLTGAPQPSTRSPEKNRLDPTQSVYSQRSTGATTSSTTIIPSADPHATLRVSDLSNRPTTSEPLVPPNPFHVSPSRRSRTTDTVPSTLIFTPEHDYRQEFSTPNSGSNRVGSTQPSAFSLAGGSTSIRSGGSSSSNSNYNRGLTSLERGGNQQQLSSNLSATSANTKLQLSQLQSKFRSIREETERMQFEQRQLYQLQGTIQDMESELEKMHKEEDRDEVQLAKLRAERDMLNASLSLQ